MGYVKFDGNVWITTGREYAFGGDGAAAFGPGGELNGGLPISFGDLFSSGIGGPVEVAPISNIGGPGLDVDALLSLAGEGVPLQDLGVSDDLIAQLKARLLTAALAEKEPSKLEKLGKALAGLGKLDKKKGVGESLISSSFLGEAVPGGIPQTPPPPEVLAQGKANRGIPPTTSGVPVNLANLALLRSLFRTS